MTIIDDMDVNEGVVDLNDRQGCPLLQRPRLEAETLLGFVATEVVLGHDPGSECLQPPNDRIAARSMKLGGVAAPPSLVTDGAIRSARLGQVYRINGGVDLTLDAR